MSLFKRTHWLAGASGRNGLNAQSAALVADVCVIGLAEQTSKLLSQNISLVQLLSSNI
jgi:hypothetical protein